LRRGRRQAQPSAPANVSASARAFDPAQESDAALGGSLDTSGQLLRSATFAVVELTDTTTGQPITTLQSPAELASRLTATLGLLTDVALTGQIEMPLFLSARLGRMDTRGTGGVEG
jgi:hypothetical protein